MGRESIEVVRSGGTPLEEEEADEEGRVDGGVSSKEGARRVEGILETLQEGVK